MSAEKNKELIARMYRAMNENRVGVMPEFWTENMVWRGPAGIGTMHGVEEFETRVRQPMIRAIPDKVGEDEIRIAEGDYVAATGCQKATHTGDWLGIPASGQQIELRYIMDFWRVEGDKLAENWVLIDILGLLEQVGYDVEKVLKFIGSKPPEFFEEVE